MASIIPVCAQPAAGGAAQAQDEYYGLPDAKGREEVAAYCGACHSLGIVAQQGLTREAWEKLVKSMVAEQGMAPLPPEDEKLVLDYLTQHVGPDTRDKRLRARGILR